MKIVYRDRPDQRFEIRVAIDCAELGDTRAAEYLLAVASDYLSEGAVMPLQLQRYLSTICRNIANLYFHEQLGQNIQPAKYREALGLKRRTKTKRSELNRRDLLLTRMVWEKIEKTGLNLAQCWSDVAEQYGLSEATVEKAWQKHQIEAEQDFVKLRAWSTARNSDERQRAATDLGLNHPPATSVNWPFVLDDET